MHEGDYYWGTPLPYSQNVWNFMCAGNAMRGFVGEVLEMDKFAHKAKTRDNKERSDRALAISKHIASFIEPSCRSAMEFGCGTGLISFNLMNLFDKITLIDTSESMLSTLEEKIRTNNIQGMLPLNIDLTKDSYDGKFDVIYSSMVLHHVLAVSKIPKVMYELLDNNGQVCIVDLDTDNGDFHLSEPGFDGHNGFNHEFMRSLFNEVGFSNINIQTFYHGIKEIGDKRVPYSLFCLNAKKIL